MRSWWAGLAVVALSLIAPPASAQEDEQGELLVIMDVSGSMDENDGAGGTRIEGARAAANDLVEAVPDGTPIGLRLYGGRFDNSQKAKGCEDTQLAVPIGPVESTGPQITSEIDDATPLGFTPIGYSLQEAAGDFGDEGNRSIVLVSDGEDTCGDPDPCEVAAELAEDGIDVRVDTIGLAIEDNEKAQGQLECIAEATGGSFVEAADADELTERLSRVSRRAIEGWSAEGEEVDGGPIVTDATPIEPGTIYLDDVVSSEARWYSFPVQEGDDITVTLSEDGTLDYGCCVTIRLYQPDQQTNTSTDRGFTDEVAQIFRVGTGINSREDSAEASGDYYVSVVLDDNDSDGQPLEYQMEVVVEGDTPTTEPPDTDTESSDATDSATGSIAEDEPTTSPDEEEPPAADASSSGDGNGLLLPLVIVLIVVVAALGGVVVYLLVRMNRQSP